MELIRVFVELRYTEPHRLFRVYDDLYASLTGSEAPPKASVLPGMELTIAERKVQVLIDPDQSWVSLEGIVNRGYCLQTCLQSFRRINDVAPIPKVRRIGVRSYWIQPSQVSYDTLLHRYTQLFLKDNPLLAQATNVGIVLEMKPGVNLATIAFGPMGKEQLTRQMLRFPESDKLPPWLTFLDVDYYRLSKEQPMEYSDRFLYGFMEEALNFSE